MSHDQIEQQTTEEEEDEEQWESLQDHPDYEICRDYPYQIRRLKDGRILKENQINTGYLCVYLNGRKYLKHRLVALQWIDNPDNLPCVDHINRVRNDNRIENLRWCSSHDNACNKSSCFGFTMNWFNTLPEGAIQVEEYGDYRFDNLYYHDNQFYQYNGIQYRIIKSYMKNEAYYVNVFDVDNRKTIISLVKFKKLYNIA